MCETRKTDPYTFSADVWSLGVTIIELAEMEPPHNELAPNRVLMKIARGDPPKLQQPQLYSTLMIKFLESCLR
jgi:serine/threonine protein kinase